MVRSLNSTRALGGVAISDDFIARHPDAAVQFLMAIAQAWIYFSPQHGERVMQWYIDDSQLDYTKKALMSALKEELNYRADSVAKVDMKLTDQDIASLERGATWAQERGYSQVRPQMRNAVDHTLLGKAMNLGNCQGVGLMFQISAACAVVEPQGQSENQYRRDSDAKLEIAGDAAIEKRLYHLIASLEMSANRIVVAYD